MIALVAVAEIVFAVVAAGAVFAAAFAVVVETEIVFLRQFQEKLMRVILLLFRVTEIQIPVSVADADIYLESFYGETDFHVSDYCLVAPMVFRELVLVSLLP